MLGVCAKTAVGSTCDSTQLLSPFYRKPGKVPGLPAVSSVLCVCGGGGAGEGEVEGEREGRGRAMRA